MEEVIIRIDSETLGTDGPDKQLLGRLSILNYEGYIDGSITITVINKFEHVNV